MSDFDYEEFYIPTSLDNNKIVGFEKDEILKDILSIGEKEMNKPVEIEFAVELDNKKGLPGTFYILQIRPILYLLAACSLVYISCCLRG